MAVRCKHCNRPIHESIDPNLPWVHDDSGNAMCDVTDPASAVELAQLNFTGMRLEAEPRADDEGFDEGDGIVLDDENYRFLDLMQPEGMSDEVWAKHKEEVRATLELRKELTTLEPGDFEQ